MANEKKRPVRGLRKARHGWFDYEVLDVFGDELGPFGLTVYMVLARLCYGGTRVCRSPRELENDCRMKKSKLAECINTLVRLNLIFEVKGRTTLSRRCFDLLDVKDLIEQMLGWGIAVRQSDGTVRVADSYKERFPVGWREALEASLGSNHPVTIGDAPSSLQSPGDGIEDLEAFEMDGLAEGNCPPHGQMEGFGRADGFEGDFAADLAATRTDGAATRTDLSATRTGFNYKKEEIEKNNTPPTPASGGSGDELIFPNEIRRRGDPNFVFCRTMAAAWVRRRCGFSDRRYERFIGEALELELDRAAGGMTLDDLARTAASEYTEHRRMHTDGLLKFNIPTRQFFAEGACFDRNKWGIDARQARAMSAAAVGMRTNGESHAEPAGDQRLAAWIDANARMIASAYPDLAQRVRLEANFAATGTKELTQIDAALQAIEDELVAKMLASAPGGVLNELREKAAQDLGQARVRMTDVQQAEVIQQHIERALVKARGLPRLSVFYMPANFTPGNGHDVTVQPDPWKAVKAELERQLERLPAKQRAKAVVLYSKWVEPVVLAAIEMDGDAPVWKLASPYRNKTEQVLSKFRRVVAPLIRKVAKAEVQLVVVNAAEVEP